MQFTVFSMIFRSIYLLTIVLVIIGCTKNDNQYSFVYDNYGVKSPKEINVDHGIKNLYPDSFELITSKTTPNSVLGTGDFLEVINDSILIVVVQNKILKKINIQASAIIEEKKFIGRGPGEYNHIDDILKGNSSLFIVDKQMLKVIEYDFNLNHVRDISLSDVDIVNQRSNTALFSSAFYYPIQLNENYLFSRIDIENEASSKYFHKRLIPIGKQPVAYNEFILSPGLNNDQFLITSVRMPIFFIYDEFLNLKNLYRLNSKIIDKVETNSKNNSIDNNSPIILNPPPKILDTQKRIRFNGFTILDAIYAENKIFIYFSNRFINDRYLIVLKKQNNKWIHSGNYRFLKNDDDLFTIFDMKYSAPWLYLSSQFEQDIIRIDSGKL